jgi:hypothetical protein
VAAPDASLKKRGKGEGIEIRDVEVGAAGRKAAGLGQILGDCGRERLETVHIGELPGAASQGELVTKGD